MLWTILIGLIVGLLARLVLPGKQAMGWIMTILLGIAGSFLGGFIGRAMGLYQADEPAGMFMAVIGAVILLVIYGMLTKRRA